MFTCWYVILQITQPFINYKQFHSSIILAILYPLVSQLSTGNKLLLTCPYSRRRKAGNTPWTGHKFITGHHCWWQNIQFTSNHRTLDENWTYCMNIPVLICTSPYELQHSTLTFSYIESSSSSKGTLHNQTFKEKHRFQQISHISMLSVTVARNSCFWQ